jgi:hypothetical protein
VVPRDLMMAGSLHQWAHCAHNAPTDVLTMLLRSPVLMFNTNTNITTITNNDITSALC